MAATTEYIPTVMEVLMKRKKVSQVQVGQAIGRDQAVVSNIKNGRQLIDQAEAEQIAKMLGLSRPHLLLTPFDPKMDYDGNDNRI